MQYTPLILLLFFLMFSTTGHSRTGKEGKDSVTIKGQVNAGISKAYDLTPNGTMAFKGQVSLLRPTFLEKVRAEVGISFQQKGFATAYYKNGEARAVHEYRFIGLPLFLDFQPPVSGLHVSGGITPTLFLASRSRNVLQHDETLHQVNALNGAYSIRLDWRKRWQQGPTFLFGIYREKDVMPQLKELDRSRMTSYGVVLGILFNR